MRLDTFLSIPKSLYVSWMLCGAKHAFRLPIFVRHNCRLVSLKGVMKAERYSTGMIRFGFGDVPIIDGSYNRCMLQIDGALNLSSVTKEVWFGEGSKLCIGKDGTLQLDDNFKNSAATTIICMNYIQIGKNFLSSWDTTIIDTDFHKIVDLNTGCTNEMTKPITIGDNVWMGFGSSILKGSNVPDGCVIAAHALVSGIHNQQNCLLAGVPARIVKEGVSRDI